MPDEENGLRQRKRWIIGIVLPVFYLLSIGPFFGIISRLIEWGGVGLAPRATVVAETVYAPVLWLASGLGLERFLDWYIDLFV